MGNRKWRNKILFPIAYSLFTRTQNRQIKTKERKQNGKTDPSGED